MEKVKIQDLEVGKIYKAFYKGVEHGIYKIENNKKLFTRILVKNIIGWEESKFYYNELIDYTTFQEIKREIDWTKVPRGTKVQVRDSDKEEWQNAYFIKYNNIDNFHFNVGIHLDDDFMGHKIEHCNSSWKCCRIHESVQILDEWCKE